MSAYVRITKRKCWNLMAYQVRVVNSYAAASDRVPVREVSSVLCKVRWTTNCKYVKEMNGIKNTT
jgi:hypothetical protein